MEIRFQACKKSIVNAEDISCKRKRFRYSPCMHNKGKRPEIGQIIVVRDIECKIVKIHPFGTVDVESLDGKHNYRVSGLNFI